MDFSASTLVTSFVMRMFSVHAPATIAAADRHFARHHLPVLAVYLAHNLRRSPHHRDQDSPTGSFGTVYFRILGDTLVAVKEPFQELEALRCFVNEVRMVEMLPHSINVVRTLGLAYGPSNDRPTALVMTKYSGTLHSFILTGGKSYCDSYDSESDAAQRAGSTSLASYGYVRLLLHLLAGIANGLAHLHACGIVHNDLSESNVFVDHPAPDKSPLALPEAVVGDLGRATCEDACGEILYRCRWLARRTAHETHLSTASDVFSLGTIVLSALGGVGGPPVHKLKELSAVATSSFITDCLPKLSPGMMTHVVAELRGVVETCTQTMPAKRPSAVCVRDRLRRLMNMRDCVQDC